VTEIKKCKKVRNDGQIIQSNISQKSFQRKTNINICEKRETNINICEKRETNINICEKSHYLKCADVFKIE